MRSTSEWGIAEAWSRRIRRTACITASRKSEAIGHVEEDVDVAVNAAEQFLTGTHSKYWDVGEGVYALGFVSVSLLVGCV